MPDLPSFSPPAFSQAFRSDQWSIGHSSLADHPAPPSAASHDVADFFCLLL